ncbi:MAG TPA: phosphotransferase, partial [Aggregatilineales bacterium]|nr:phosphotransferase [Aggregatilineales bacterium]
LVKPDTYSTIRSEAEFLDHLHRSGVSVAHPLRQANGDWLLTLNAVEGQRYALLFTFAEGVQISAQTDLHVIERYGDLVARLHRAADAYAGPADRAPITFKALVDEGIERLAVLRPQFTDAIAYFRQIADLLRPQLETWPTASPYYGLCHGDVSPSNVHVAPDGSITLFDFHLAGPCWRIYDVASFVSTIAYKRLPAALSSAFLEGYQHIRPLAPSEYQAIPVIQILRKYITLSLFTNAIEPFGSYQLTDEFMQMTLDQIKSIVPELYSTPTATNS